MGQMTLADPWGLWSEDGPSGLPWHVHWPGLYASTWMGHCTEADPQKLWRLKIAHWKHFQQLGGESLKGGQNSTSPGLHGLCRSSRGRWWECTVGETLGDWHVSQNDDLVILLSALWCEKEQDPHVGEILHSLGSNQLLFLWKDQSSS